MKQEVYDLTPQWIKEANKGQYEIMVGDDIDSLATASVLNQVFGWEINWFYDFRNIYVSNEFSDKERVGCDMALEKGKTVDNHAVLLKPTDYVNDESVNMNTIYKVSRLNYKQKYAMSTVLLVWSLLGLPLPETDEGKKILLTIDSSFKGHYDSRFRKVHDEWLRKLGFEELIDFLDNNTTYEELDVTIRKKYGLSMKIYINKHGQLKHGGLKLSEISRVLGIDIILPHQSFKLDQELHRGNCNVVEFQRKNNGKPLVKSKSVFSFALTYGDVASYTMI